MSDHDGIWIGLADGLWDGSLGPDDLPHWCADLSIVVTAAHGPATAEELAPEPDVVATMQRILRGDAAEAGEVRGAPKLRQLVAAKLVAVAAIVAVGATAAAATAGVVVPLLIPAENNPRPPAPVQSTPLPAAPADLGGEVGDARQPGSDLAPDPRMDNSSVSADPAAEPGNPNANPEAPGQTDKGTGNGSAAPTTTTTTPPGQADVVGDDGNNHPGNGAGSVDRPTARPVDPAGPEAPPVDEDQPGPPGRDIGNGKGRGAGGRLSR